MKKNNEFQEHQAFSYHSCFWLKTLIAICFLPIGLIIGSIFKGISYTFKSVKQRNSQYQQFKNRIKINEKIYDELGVKFSSEKIACDNIERPALTPTQIVQVKALKAIAEALNNAKIAYWLECGSALGAKRHGGMIPWDNDIDLGTLMIDHHNVMAALQKALDPKEYEVLNWSSFDRPNSYIRVGIKKINSWIDIYHYQINEKEKTVNYVFAFENATFLPEKFKKRERACTKPLAYDVLFPLKKADFDGLEVPVANQIEPFLKSKYGEDLRPARVWNPTTQQYDKVPDHPYWKQSHI